MSNEYNNSVIIDAVRSPIGMIDGKMAGIRPDNLMAQILSGLLTRNQHLPVHAIEDVVLGCAFPEGPQGMLLARGAAILAGLPPETGGKVVNRFDGASMDALHQVDAAIRLGDYQAAIACGVEDLRSVPAGGFNPSFHPELHRRNYYLSPGEAAEILAREGKISRDVQEEFASNSHNKALDAWDNGYFDNEVIPVQYNNHIIVRDEGPGEPDPEKMSTLPPLFAKEGSITAATSSPEAIGAAAVLLTSEDFARQHSLKPRARILSRAICGVSWERAGSGPLPATEKALSRAGLDIDDIDIIELDETFAAQALYAILKSGWPFNKINLNGGAIALGHPPGCAGARIITTLINLMEQQSARYGLAAMAIGGGQGIATVIERIGGDL